MREAKAKKARKYLFNKGIAISSFPYEKLSNGQIIASKGRRSYQSLKKSY